MSIVQAGVRCAVLATTLVLTPAAAADTSRAAEWQHLRSTPGHFDGAAWNDDVDRWDGAKHRLMREMADEVVARRATAREAKALWGAPNARLRPGTPAHRQSLETMSQPCAVGVRAGPGDALWIYAWRGRHDQLALVLRHGRVVGCGWLLAGE